MQGTPARAHAMQGTSTRTRTQCSQAARPAQQDTRNAAQCDATRAQREVWLMWQVRRPRPPTGESGQ
eukprot:9998516-Alexandrium_andersonii.AAC.1